MLESGDKELSLVEYRPALPIIDAISAVHAVPERPLQQFVSCRQHKPQGCGKSTEGGRMLGDHRGTLGLNVASIWLPASSRASGGDLLKELPYRGGNAVAEVVSRSSGSRTDLDSRLLLNAMGVICSRNSHTVAAMRSPKSSVAAPAPEPTLILDCSDCGPPKWTRTLERRRGAGSTSGSVGQVVESAHVKRPARTPPQEGHRRLLPPQRPLVLVGDNSYRCTDLLRSQPNPTSAG